MLCVGSSWLVSLSSNTVSYGLLSFSTYNWGHTGNCGNCGNTGYCFLLSNLVSGQSTLIFIYSTYTDRHLFGFSFCSNSRSARFPWELSVCSCILCKIHIQFASWTSVQISNIDYKYLPAWQPQVQSPPVPFRSVPSSSFHFPLDMLECCCFYIKLQLCLWLDAYMYICIYDFICPTAVSMCVCVFLLITEIIKISLLCIIADFSSVCSGLPIYELVLLDWVFKWQASSELQCSTYKNTYIYVYILATICYNIQYL